MVEMLLYKKEGKHSKPPCFSCMSTYNYFAHLYIHCVAGVTYVLVGTYDDNIIQNNIVCSIPITSTHSFYTWHSNACLFISLELLD